MAKKKQDSKIPSQTCVPQQDRFTRPGEDIATNTKPTDWPLGGFRRRTPATKTTNEFMHNSTTNGKK